MEDASDALAEGCRLEPFAPRHLRQLAACDFLDLVGELMPQRLISRAPSR